MSVLLEARELGFHHGGRAILDRVSFQARAGECIALLGNNGAGKSTLLDLLAGLRQPGSGEITLAGQALDHWRPDALARTVSHLPQAVAVDLPFTAGELVTMGRYPHGSARDESPEDQRAIARALDRTGCAAWRDCPLGTLSGGERQRVLLAAVLAQEAQVLLLDEPATYLDLAHQLGTYTLLREEAAAGRLCLAVTHDLNLALRFCTRLLILAEGRLVKDLSVAQAAADPGWLQLFSPRLRLQQSSPPWVWYA